MAGDRLVESPVIILSTTRSGSTLLRCLLDAHPAVRAPHELHVADLHVQLASPYAQLSLDVAGLELEEVEHLLWDRLLHRELVRSGKQVIVDKVPGNVLIWERLARAWPAARFVFLLRHPANIVASAVEAGPDRDREELTAQVLRYMTRLQTEDYARALISGNLPMAGEQDVEARVRARMERQAVLTKDDPLRLWAVVDEAALHRLVGGAKVMYEQLTAMLATTRVPHVTVQVISYAAGAHAGMQGSFALMDFPNPADPAVVHIDSMAGDLFLETEADVRRYSLIFDNLRAVALSPADSASLLTTLAERSAKGGV